MFVLKTAFHKTDERAKWSKHIMFKKRTEVPGAVLTQSPATCRGGSCHIFRE